MSEYEEVLRALREKEGQLVRRIDAYTRKSELLQVDLSTARAWLSFEAQEVDGADFLPHMSVRRQFKSGELRKYCLEALRKSPDGLDTREVTRYAMTRKGLDTTDAVIRKRITSSVQSMLRFARRNNLVVSEPRRRLGVRVWRLTSGKKEG